MDSNACLPHLLVFAITLVLVSHAMGDSAQDKQRCAESLTGVTTCLPYLGGDTKSPTADCCSGLTQAMKTNKKCVCVILKDRDDPDLGLKINMTIAAGLPSLCKTPDNFSQCSGMFNFKLSLPFFLKNSTLQCYVSISYAMNDL